MITISFSDEIIEACPKLNVLAISCDIKNADTEDSLWEKIGEAEKVIRSCYKINEVSRWPQIHATREVYKKLGKDPNRYRPSAEALRRRIIRNLPLYRINSVVDIINLVSIQTGFSIGGFDFDKIEGQLVLGVGREDEPFDAISRGELNIHGLPVYRDTKGGIGTPTSDEERTKVELKTEKLLMLINGFSGMEGLIEAAMYAKELLKRYASADNFEFMQIDAKGMNKEAL